ncbi:MAG: hypothetical protein ABJA02_11755 [Acidobacteriota bacterium]
MIDLLKGMKTEERVKMLIDAFLSLSPADRGDFVSALSDLLMIRPRLYPNVHPEMPLEPPPPQNYQM